MTEREQELDGDDWVLFDPKSSECVLHHSGRGMLTFASNEDAIKFRDQHDALAHFDPKQVKNIKVSKRG